MAALTCLTTALGLFSCAKKMTEEEWRAAFALENVRVDCTVQQQNKEPVVGDPLYNGTHYLFDGELAAVGEVEQQLIGESAPTYYELLYEERRDLVRLFNFTDLFDEFERQSDGTYFCEAPSYKDFIWAGDTIKNATVSFSEGKLEKITYTYYGSPLAQPTVYTFTFSLYGEVELEAPAK